MLVYQLARVALAAVTLLGQSVTAQKPCRNPSVRREWRSLSAHERADWIDAVKCLNTLPHNSSLTPTFNTTYTVIPPINKSSSYFDDWVYTHMDLNPLIHATAHFLPWHRAYVRDFNAALQDKCGYKGTQPYWNWTLDASDFQNSSFWDPNPTSGVGGWGDPNDDDQITDGGFAHGFPLSYPSPHRLRRAYAPTFPGRNDSLAAWITPEFLKTLINGFVGDFIGFQDILQSQPHVSIHGMVGGDLFGNCPTTGPASCVVGQKWSPNDPLFMLHHATVDKIWDDWQRTHPANFWSFAGGSTLVLIDAFTPDPAYTNGAPPYVQFSTPIPTDGIMNNYTIYELMDIRNERLCYIYE